MTDPEDPSTSPEARLHRWLAMTQGQPPEWIASFTQSPRAPWVVVTEDGPENDRQRRAARLDEAEEIPYWAFALAKSYLDDVGEWPLFGMEAETALDAYEIHGEIAQATREIIHAVHSVWPDVEVIFIGEESHG
ncbi:MAG: hypothetical protein HQL51_04330 [Magnetococcales bacterium]|nr:hypothetical protein [Magnetococcales bacterium]